MKPEKAALSILKGIFEGENEQSWIGPRIFNVWGLPSSKKLSTASLEEIKFISNTAENIYTSLG